MQNTAQVRHFYPIAERARRQLGREIWNIGVIDQPIADVAMRGIKVTPRWLEPLPPGQMRADPACRRLEMGGYRLYAEHLAFDRGVGELWSADVLEGQNLASAKFLPLLVPDHHISYPFPLDDGTDRLLMTAETFQAGAALLWEEVEGRLVPLGPLLPGRQVIDPTLWHDDYRWWLFCTLHNQDPDRNLFLFHSTDLVGPWIAHPANPVKRDRVGARPAGPLFNAGTMLIRPGQDSSRTYGGGIVLHEITRLDPEGYDERVLRRLEPPAGPYARGLHTMCTAGDSTIVDGKFWKFDFRYAGRQLRRTLRGT